MGDRETVQEFLAATAADASGGGHLLAPDLVWEWNGGVQTEGAQAFLARQAEDAEGSSEQRDVDVLLADGGDVVLVGWLTFTPDGGGPTTRLRIASWFSLEDGRITRIRDVMAPTAG